MKRNGSSLKVVAVAVTLLSLYFLWPGRPIAVTVAEAGGGRAERPGRYPQCYLVQAAR